MFIVLREERRGDKKIEGRGKNEKDPSKVETGTSWSHKKFSALKVRFLSPVLSSYSIALEKYEKKEKENRTTLKGMK